MAELEQAHTIAARIDSIAAVVVKIQRERSEAVELLIRVADTLPQSCECNYETVEGRTVGQKCLPHQALEFIEKLPK